MSKRNLLNLVLLIIILLLISIVLFEPGKDKAVTPPTLTSLNVDEINHIKIQRQSADINEKELEFNKTSEGWSMNKPFQLSANNFRIESILKLLATVSLSQNNLESLNSKTFGLTNPSITITFNKNTTIEFGHNKSLKNHRYVKIGSTLHMIADTFYYQLTAKSESYIDHKLLPENNKIIKLVLPGMTLVQRDSTWEVTPKAGDSSADSVNQLIDEWLLSQAYDLDKISIDTNIKPDVLLLLSNGDNIRFKIEHSDNSFNLLNIDKGIRYILAKERKNKLLKLSSVDQDT